MNQQRKPIFFTSDWHLGHANSIKFDDRPFKTVEEMHRKLIRNFNAIVPEHGICYHLGDVGMANVETTKGVIDQLNGTQILILGNHDGNVNRMYNCGFDAVMYGVILYIAGEKVTLTHCPLRGIFREDVTNMRGSIDGENWHKEFKHQMFSTEDIGQFHLHGHIHARGKDNGKLVKDERQWDVGLPGNNYRPVHISAVESWISKYKQQERK